mmetsp:Transcript_9847/g.32075  ORF Transcript_9847/g.32075 Transcript_9847/m.32075 type:complete len:457 (-) Transcript_9847:261-1631(-)
MPARRNPVFFWGTSWCLLLGAALGFQVPLSRVTTGRTSSLRAVDPVLVDQAMAVVGDHHHLHTMSTMSLSAITGSTCVEDSGWWCSIQNTVEGSIESLHGAVVAVGMKQNSYGFSIIIFTAMARLLTFPLTYLSYQSSDRVKALKPYMDQIKERYKDNQQEMNLATAKLYEMTATNPLAGCLPSLAQIPVFIALYRSVLNLAFAHKLDESFFWLPSLEGPTYDQGRGIGWLLGDWIDGVPPLGWHDTIAFLALPIALVITQSLSMRVMSPPADPEDVAAQRTQRVLKYLPLLIGWFSANVPAGLGLYWMTSNLFTVGSSVASKAYLKANPPTLDIDFKKLGIDDGSAGVKLPNTIEEAIAQAKINAAPSRLPRRAGIPPMTLFDVALAKQNLDAFPSTVFDLSSGGDAKVHDDDDIALVVPVHHDHHDGEISVQAIEQDELAPVTTPLMEPEPTRR